MTATLPCFLQAPLDRWVAAEVAGDCAALDTVLHQEILFAGPYGYLLDRRAWLDRFSPGAPHATTFSRFAFTPDVPARLVQTGTTRGRSPAHTEARSSSSVTPSGLSSGCT